MFNQQLLVFKSLYSKENAEEMKIVESILLPVFYEERVVLAYVKLKANLGPK